MGRREEGAVCTGFGFPAVVSVWASTDAQVYECRFSTHVSADGKPVITPGVRELPGEPRLRLVGYAVRETAYDAMQAMYDLLGWGEYLPF